MTHIDVQVRSFDRITTAGIVNYLQSNEGIRIVGAAKATPAVLVLAVDRITSVRLHRLIGPFAADGAAP